MAVTSSKWALPGWVMISAVFILVTTHHTLKTRRGGHRFPNRTLSLYNQVR